MGLLGKKEACGICGGKTGILSINVNDGKICRDCTKSIGGTFGININSFDDFHQYRESLKDNEILLNTFMITNKENPYIFIDTKNKLFKIGKKNAVNSNKVFHFNELIDYEYVEDGETITKGGIGSAVVGGALFGAVGAIVGGTTGKKKTKPVVTDMHIRISLNNKWISNMTIELLSSETKKSSMTYGLMKSSSERIISLLDLIVRQSENVTDPVQNTSSVADEILKFKNLLDIGAITLEEFEAKKKQLLNL